MAKLLNTYQLWLDDLYPRAKFADGLAIIEKLGHSKRMQVMRKEWILEGKYARKAAGDATMPRLSQGPEDRTTGARPSASAANDPAERPATFEGDLNRPSSIMINPELREADHSQHDVGGDSLFVSDDEQGRDDLPEDDLDALLAEDHMKPKARFPEEDDLDALLAEDEMNVRQSRSEGQPIIANEAQNHKDRMFDDEMEAMAAADDWR